MTGWEPRDYNPLTSAPRSPTLRDMAKPEPTDEASVTVNGSSIILPWPFLVAPGDDGPTIDILISD
jgi:hypothetical protein